MHFALGLRVLDLGQHVLIMVFYTFGLHCYLISSNSLALRRFSKHWRSVCEGELWATGPDSGSAMAQREHWTLWGRPRENHHFWLWGWSLMRQPSHPVPSFWRFETVLPWSSIKKNPSFKGRSPKINMWIFGIVLKTISLFVGPIFFTIYCPVFWIF